MSLLRNLAQKIANFGQKSGKKFSEEKESCTTNIGDKPPLANIGGANCRISAVYKIALLIFNNLHNLRFCQNRKQHKKVTLRRWFFLLFDNLPKSHFAKLATLANSQIFTLLIYVYCRKVSEKWLKCGKKRKIYILRNKRKRK